MKFGYNKMSYSSSLTNWHMYFNFDQGEHKEFDTMKGFLIRHFSGAKFGWSENKSIIHVFTTNEQHYLFALMKWL